MEVKGVTLEQDGAAMFPDAPTERGVKHIMELREVSSGGIPRIYTFRDTDERHPFLLSQPETPIQNLPTP